MKLILKLVIGLSLWPGYVEAEANSKPADPTVVTKKETVRAESFGFDAEDATTCLQAAIDSGARRVIIGKMTSDWTIGKPITLASDQELVFEDGVVIKAKIGAFKHIGDSLFSGKNLQNITLRGIGNVTLKMRKRDYQDADQYQQGEWRHGIVLAGCTNIVIKNITIRDTGGDGIYIGAAEQPYCKNILIEDITLDANHRLGIAVISAEDLVIRRCRFVNASGASPQGGIDFEPNRPVERLVNCIVEDSVFASNLQGAGISIAPNQLSSDSEPVSVIVRRCSIERNALGLFLYMSRRSKLEPASGLVRIEECQITGNTSAAALVQDALSDGIKIEITQCTIDNTSANSEAFVIKCQEAIGKKVGGLTFKDTTIKDLGQRAPLVLQYHGNGEISDDFAGTVIVENEAGKSLYDFQKFIASSKKIAAELNALKPATVDLSKVQPFGFAAERQGNDMAYLRGRFTFIQYAAEGEEVEVRVSAVKVGDYYGDVELKLLQPDGELFRTIKVPLGSDAFPVRFKAPTSGIYRFVSEGTVQRVDISGERKGNGILLGAHQSFLPISGRFYFQVPSGVERFSIGISADAGAKVSLFNSKDEVAFPERDIHSMELLTFERPKGSPSEIWSIGFSKVGWHLSLRFSEPLYPIVSTNPDTLLVIP